jgi:hypothetical protein
MTCFFGKGGTMQVGDVIHLDGLKAEYSLFGKDRFSNCTLPDGNYVILSVEDEYIKLAWSDSDGLPSRKHRYRIRLCLIGPPSLGHLQSPA